MLSLLAAIAGASPPAPATPPPTVEADDAKSASEIVVTARRQSEPLSRTPAPVSAVAGADLRRDGIQTADRLPDRFPALTVLPSASGNLLFVRGVGNFTLQPNADPAVAYAVDGVFVSRPMGTLSQFLDLDRIELFKGPQGVLYGRNATAGSINLEPRQPVPGQTSIAAEAELATGAQRRTEAALNLPVGRDGAVRLSAGLGDQDNALEGYRTGPIQQGLRLQLLHPIGRVKVRVMADYSHLGGVGIGSSYLGNYVYDPATRSYQFNPAGTPLSAGLYSDEGQAFRQTVILPTLGRTLDALASSPAQDDDFIDLHAHIDAPIAGMTLSLVPAWRRGSVDAIVSGPPFGYGQRDLYRQASLETRLRGQRGALDWLVGTYVTDETTRADTATNVSAQLSLAQQRFRTRSRAVFANVGIAPAPGLRLSAGARLTRDAKDYDSQTQSLILSCLRLVSAKPSCPTVPLLPLVRDFADVPFVLPAGPGERVPVLVGGVPTGAILSWSERTDGDALVDRAFTWRLGAERDLGRTGLAYATIETGYKPGGFNAATGYETFRPETITAYTLGLRTRRNDRRADLAAEAYWWDYRDQQVSALRPDRSSPPRNANITDNIARSRIRGVELELGLRPWAASRLHVDVQWLDAAYRHYRFIQSNIGTPPLTGCPVALDPTTNLYTVDCTGFQPYASPRWTVGGGVEHRLRLAGQPLAIRFDSQLRTGRSIGFAFLPQRHVGTTSRSNLQVEWSPPSSRFSLGLFVRNLENRRVPEFSIYHPVSNALIAGTSAPRTLGLRVVLHEAEWLGRDHERR